MTQSSANLETFDFLELLVLLAGQGRTGALRVERPDGTFQAWLEGGRLRHLGFGERQGAAALVHLLREPRGRFGFDEGLRHLGPGLDLSVDEVALEALTALPVPELPFGGPARVTSPERLARLRMTLREQALLGQIERGRPLSELAGDPAARGLIAGLVRLGLLARREVRVARLTVTVTREVTGVAVLDGVIWDRWRDDLGRPFAHVAVRAPAGAVVTLPVRGGASLGAQLLVPPEVLLRAGWRAGESVLVRPI
ncbi:hypothetical protein DAETH_18480 [Deinococcus aetherius]|uniref:PatA-like N-terminal domain-containing protein n=1 Tax=Deinococcus aetherius TaxID=200252 RepID=A0ABN6RJ39_9DEIO|nr:DUF4388 domain-containing protein [Deinococcus aetherius]BDP41879.1 hypothetical protein DAETH_18480 [Deinococcus aetherius]